MTNISFLVSSAIMATTKIPPLTLPTLNLLAAYDARSGITVVSGAVSQWNDLSGNGFHATQGTAESRPLVSSSAGYTSLYFDGSNDIMQISGITSTAGQKTIYVVANPTANSNPQMFMGGFTGVTGMGSLNAFHAANDGVGWRSTTTAYTSGKQRVTYQFQSGSFAFWKNGVAAPVVTSWTTNPTFTSSTRIGAIAPSTWTYLGHMYALFIYTGARNTDVEAYITQEWGV